MSPIKNKRLHALRQRLLERGRQVKKTVPVEYLVSLTLLGTIVYARYGNAWYREKRVWWFTAGMALFYLSSKIRLLRKVPALLQEIISSKVCIFILSGGFLLSWFITCFPLGKWGSYILAGDYPAVFGASRQGWEIIRQGGYLGWSPWFLGGYFTVADIGLNLIHFLLPFSLFGWETGFHLMVLFFFLCFPFLCFYYMKICCRVGDREALVALPIACVFVLVYFNDLLRWGLVAALIGIDLTILALIFLQKVREEKAFSFPLLLIVLSSLLYTHPGIFSFCIALLLIDSICRPARHGVRHAFLLTALLFPACLLLLSYKIRYAKYLNINPYHYAPLPYPSFGAYMETIKINAYYLFIDIARWRKRLFVTPRTFYMYPVFFLPILLYLSFWRKWRRQLLFIVFLLLVLVFTTPQVEHWLSRVNYLIPFFLSTVVAGFLVINYHKATFIFLLAALLSGLALFLPIQHYVVKHGPPGNFYNKPLVDEIKTLDGAYVAVENNQYFPNVTKCAPGNFYWLPLLRLETGKRFFSNMRGGYHFSSYRGNSIESGFLRGKPIDAWRIEDINAIVSQWGIRYLALGSEKSKRYFSRYPQYYAKVWEDSDWIIFAYLNADTRDVVVEHNGSGVVAHEDYFSKVIQLRGVKEGSRVVVRSNYFPAWKAYYNNTDVPLINCNGQTGFRAPVTGDYTVTMQFPRYTAFYVMAATAFLLSVFLSYKRIVP